MIVSNNSRGVARLGIVVPVTNTNLEPDMVMLRPDGVSLHFARAGGYDIDEIPDSEQMRKFANATLDEVVDGLKAALADMILYGCTSATLSHGPDYDRAFVERIETRAGVPAITAASAVVEAAQDLDVTKVGFCSPYTELLNAEAAAFLGACGIEVVSDACVGDDLGNYGQSALKPDDVFELGCRADSPAAQAIILSCTDMRALEAIDALGARLNKPMITSNQALMYTAIKRLNLVADVPEILGDQRSVETAATG